MECTSPACAVVLVTPTVDDAALKRIVHVAKHSHRKLYVVHVREFKILGGVLDRWCWCAWCRVCACRISRGPPSPTHTHSFPLQGKPHTLRSLTRARLMTARTVLTLRQSPARRPVNDSDFFFVDKLAIFTTLLVDTKYVVWASCFEAPLLHNACSYAGLCRLD